MTTAEKCATWVRVSSGGQDEENQVPDVNAHVTEHGYNEVRRFQLHAKSAYKGKQEPELREMIADIAAGKYTVVVIWHSDRLDRRGPKFAWATLAAVELAGGRIESVKDPEFGKDDFAAELATSVGMSIAKQKSRHQSEQLAIAKVRITANGAHANRRPWGFTTEGPKYSRRLVPTEQARLYVPQIYKQIIAKKSLATVAAWLNEQGVKPTGIANEKNPKGKNGLWWPEVLSGLIRNPVYMGHECERAEVPPDETRERDGEVTGYRYGEVWVKRPRLAWGNVTHQWTTDDCPPLVDAHTWKLANDRLDNAPRRGPSWPDGWLSGIARCERCGGKLFRIDTGPMDGRRTTYLRCGQSGRRKGCGAPMIRWDVAEPLSDAVLGALPHEEMERDLIVKGNGAEIAAQLAAIDFDKSRLSARNLSWDDLETEIARLKAEHERVMAIEETADVYGHRLTGRTYGDIWREMTTPAERAAWLQTGTVEISFARGGPYWQAQGYHESGVAMWVTWPDDDDTTGGGEDQ